TGGSRSFINFTKQLIDRKVPLIFPPEVTTIEILENITPDAQFTENCRELSKAGFQLALDDFEYDEALNEIIALADIIKIDFLSTSPDRIKNYVNTFMNRNCAFLAEKVETNEQFRMACDMGFSYFQGYFFSKPEVMDQTEIPTLKMNLLQIMSASTSDKFNVDELDKLIERDLGISYKLLRYLNSPFFRRNNEITYIKHAIMLLGEKGVKGFLSVIIMAEMSQDKPDELLRSSVMRARLCENLGRMDGKRIDPSELFTLGLFSLIDAILDSPMERVLQKLPLAQEIKNALLNENNRISDYLRLVEQYEKGDWNTVLSLSSRLGLDTEKLPEAYFEALGFADALLETTKV
ncbi:HDOD domain-containing protein, partial [bacterium]|nr:HDOD domain-containing protein [bacterium]